MAEAKPGSGASSDGGDPVVAWVEASCAAQGLSVKVTDAGVIGRVRSLVGDAAALVRAS